MNSYLKYVIGIGALIGVLLSAWLLFNQSVINERQGDFIDTSNWKTYTNPVTQYQLQYPSQWEVEEIWKTRAGRSDLYSQKGATVSFRDTLGEYPNSLMIQSVPVLVSEFPCWDLLGTEGSSVDGFTATKSIYTPDKSTVKGVNCTENTIPSSMRFVRVAFEDPDSIFPGYEYTRGVSYELAFTIEESDLELVETIISTVVIPESEIASDKKVSDRVCGLYTHNEVSERHCATCGNNICEAFEVCTSSHSSNTMETNDCGPLYCPEDCTN